MSNIGYGQDRPYGAIDDDDDFMEEWRASWEPAAHTHIDDVIAVSYTHLTLPTNREV